MGKVNVDPQDSTPVKVGQMLGGMKKSPTGSSRVTSPFTVVYPIPRTGSVVALENPIGTDCMVSARIHVKTVNGSALTVDVGVDNASPYATNDRLLDAVNLNAAGIADGRGSNGGEDRLLQADGAVVVDLSGNAAAALVADLIVTYTPIG